MKVKRKLVRGGGGKEEKKVREERFQMLKKKETLNDNSQAIVNLQIASKELLLVHSEIKADILLARDEKAKTMYYIERIINYLSARELSTKKPVKVIGSNDATLLERLAKYTNWKYRIQWVYSIINWNIDLEYAGIDMKILKGLFYTLFQHINSKINYLTNELIKFETNNKGYLAQYQPVKHSKIDNLINCISKYIKRK